MDRARPVLHAALRARSWRARQLWYLLLVASTAAFVYAALHFLRDDWFYRGRLQHARCVVKPARSWLMTIEELFPEAVGPQGWSRLLTKYKLHFYVNDSNDLKLHGVPVLFAPGHGGGATQIRQIAAAAFERFAELGGRTGADVRFDFFAIDQNSEYSGFHGNSLMEQSEFLNDCVRLILEIYKSSRYVDANLLATDNVLMIGHSMGGIAVRAMFLHDNFTPNSVRAIVTLATPHSGPVVPVDRTLVQIYRRVHEYWQRGENAALADVSIISILPGANDKLINSESGMLQDLPPSLAKLVFWTSSIPTVWTCPDHNRIIQCRSISLALADILYAHHEADGRLKAPPERIRAVARLLRFSISDTLHTLPVHTSPGDIIPRTPTTSVALNNSAWMKVEHLSTLILNGVDSSSPAPTTTQIDLVTNLVFGVDFSIEVLCELCDAQTAVWPVRTRYTRLLPYSSDDFDSLVHISLGLDFDLALPGPPAARKRPRVLVRVRPADPAAPSPAVPYPFYISKAMVGKAGLLAARKSTGQSDHATEPFLKIWGQEGKAYDFPGVLWRDLAWGPVSWQIPRNVSGYFAVSFPDLTTGWPLYHLALSGQDAHKDVVVVSRCRATGEEQWFYRQSDVFIRLHGLDSPKGVDFEFWLPGMYHLTPITAELSLEVWGSLAQIFRRCLSFSLPVAFALSLQALSMSWAEPSSPHLLSMIVRPQCLLRVAATTLAIELGHRLVAWASLQIVPKSSPLHTFPGKTLQDVLLGTDSANAFAPVFVLLSGSFFILTLIGANIAANVLHRLLHTLRPARTQAYEAIPKPHQSSRLGLGVLVLFCFLAPFHYAFLVVFMMMLVHCVKVELGGAPCGETQRVFFLHVLLVLAILQLINGAPLLVWIKNVYVGWLSTKDHDPVSVLPLGLLVFAVRSGRFTPEAFSQRSPRTRAFLWLACQYLIWHALAFGFRHTYQLYYNTNFAAAVLLLVAFWPEFARGAWLRTGE